MPLMATGNTFFHGNYWNVSHKMRQPFMWRSPTVHRLFTDRLTPPQNETLPPDFVFWGGPMELPPPKWDITQRCLIFWCDVHRLFTDCLPTVWYITKKNPKYTQNSKNQRKMVTFYTKSRKTWLCPQFVHIFVCLLGSAVIQWQIHVNLENGACHVLCDQHQCAFHSLLLANVGSYCNMAKTTHNLVRDEHKTELAMRGSYGVV